MAVRPYTKDDFLALWRSVLPAEYTDPIENEASGAGFDIPSLQAAIFESAEADVNVSQQAYFLRAHSIQTGPVASGGRKATTTVEILRAAPVLGELRIRLGQVLLAKATDSLGGELFLGRFLATEEVLLPEGDGGPVEVPLAAEFEGYAGNVWEGTITELELEGRLSVPVIVTEINEVRRAVSTVDVAADRFHLGLVGRFIRLVGPLNTEDASVPRRVVGAYEASGNVVLQFDPPLLASDLMASVQVEVEELIDMGVTVVHPAPATGGVADVLRAVGEERKIERSLNETDEQFSERLQELPDVVSPDAIERITKRNLEPYSIPWCFHETGVVDELMGFTWDLHPWDIGTPCGCGETEPPGSELVGSGIVWMSQGTVTRFFIVCVGQVPVENFAAAWDATNQIGDYPNAWGLFVWNGFDVGFNEAIGRLWDDINKARMAGVGFAIVLDASL